MILTIPQASFKNQMDLSQHKFIGIKTEKSEAKTFEFSGPWKQLLLIVRVLCKNYIFSWNRKDKIQAPLFVLQKFL